MVEFRVALVPVGKLAVQELDEAASRVVKQARQPVEVRQALPLPHATEDAGRGQHRAAALIEQLAAATARLPRGKLIGGEAEASGPRQKPDGWIFVTDVDLFTAKTAGVLAALNVSRRSAVVSVRRLREAFYRRRADPNRQRTRLVKEILRMWARLQGLSECPDPKCLLAPSRSAPDIDSKSEQFCRACAARLFEGKLRL